MKRVMKRGPATAAGLLMLSLLPASLGCQMKSKALPQGTLPPQVETAAPQQPVASPVKEEGASPQKKAPVLSLREPKEKTSYTMGLDVGRDLQRQNLGLNLDALLQGVRDGLEGNKPLLSNAELDQVRQAFVSEQISLRAKTLGPQAEKNLAEGEAFLRENAKKEGVKTLPSGLQYRVLTAGSGSTPTANKNVKAHYIARSIDGTELENSYKSEKPGIFPVTGVIPAWNEAFLLMKEGDKWELFVPSHLAYGEKGVGKLIGPFQAMIFEIELIGIH